MFSGKKPSPSQQIANLEAQKTAAVRKSKSRVANVLSQPGKVVYTNKARISANFDAKIQELMSQIEKPQESASAVKSIVSSVETALKSQAARQTGAVVITIPVFVAQLFVKAARVFLAVMVFFFGLVPEAFGSEGAISNLVGKALPNRTFNTTARVYNAAKKFTGVVNSPPSVQEY